MMKFFRKYNKQMLAVIMALLMIVFIGGTALQEMLQPDLDFEVATSKLGPITHQHQRQAVMETQLLESMGQSWQYPLFSGNDPLTATDWILLGREAEKLGINVDSAAVLTNPSLGPAMDAVRLVAHNSRVKQEVVIDALAKLQAIRQTAMTIASATIPSEAEIQTAARNSLERVKIQAVLLPAEAFVDANESFPEEVINEQYQKYRERERGAGLEFGYYLPPSIQVQYIKIHRDAIAEKIGVPNEERKAKADYEANRERDPIYRRSAEELAAAPEGPDAPVYVSWEQARPAAVAKLRKQFADEHVQRVVDFLLANITEPWMGVAPAESGYKPAPKDVATLEYYASAIDRLPSQLRLENSISVHTTNFFSQPEAASVAEIGSLYVRSGGGLVARGFGSVVFNNEAIVPKIPSGNKINPADYLALFQTPSFPLVDSSTGNAYLFRVVASKPGGPPESVDQVRDKVIADLRLKNGFDRAVARAKALRACCQADEPLKEAYEADPDLAAFRETGEGAKTGYFEPPPFSRLGSTPAWSGRPADGIFVPGGLGKIPNDAIDTIFALGGQHDHLAVIELPERASVLTVEWLETVPAQEEEFAGTRKSLATNLADNRWREVINEWLNPEKIQARNGFRFVSSR